ncbi:hypothetical protein AAHE18_01G003600 [Arachis hypogaea]
MGLFVRSFLGHGDSLKKGVGLGRRIIDEVTVCGLSRTASIVVVLCRNSSSPSYMDTHQSFLCWRRPYRLGASSKDSSFVMFNFGISGLAAQKVRTFSKCGTDLVVMETKSELLLPIVFPFFYVKQIFTFRVLPIRATYIGAQYYLLLESYKIVVSLIHAAHLLFSLSNPNNN